MSLFSAFSQTPLPSSQCSGSTFCHPLASSSKIQQGEEDPFWWALGELLIALEWSLRGHRVATLVMVKLRKRWPILM
jgi:hypothetical protein